MPFDTTNVAATVGQGLPQFDPFATAGKYAALQNALNQNKLFQAQQAGGQDFQAAIGPDGSFNQNALMANVAGDPRAALTAQEMARGGAALQGQNIANTTSAQGLAAHQIGTLKSAISSVPPGPDQVKNAAFLLGQGVKNNLWTQDQATGYMSAGLPDLIKEAGIETGGPQQATQIGTPTPVSTGGATQFENVNAATGGVTPMGAPISNTLTPEQKASGVATIDPTTGQATRTTLGSLVTPAGEPRAGVAPPVVALGPAAAANLATTGQGQGQAALALQSQAAGVPSRKANLDILANEADQFQPGPQSNWWLHLQGLAKEYNIPLPGGPPADSVAAQQEFNKVATMVLAAQRSATGLTATDQQTTLAGQAAPNSQLSREGITRVIGTLKGNEDYTNAQYQLWEKSRLDPRAAQIPFDQFQASFNKNVSPLVFQSIYANPTDRAKMIQEVGPTAFKSQYKHLYNLGLDSQWPVTIWAHC